MDDIIRMAREAGLIINSPYLVPHDHVMRGIERLVALAQTAERNKVAAWMMAQGYATGHGDTMEQLLEEFKREASFDRAELWLKRINEAVLDERERLKSAAECFRMCEHKGVCNEKAKSNEAD